MAIKEEFKANVNLKFTPIDTEVRRTYVFPGGDKVVIEDPQQLCVSENGHRVWDGKISHYVPKGWIHLFWETKPHQPHFIK